MMDLIDNLLFLVMGFVLARPRRHREAGLTSGTIRCCICGSPDWHACDPGDEDGAPTVAWCARHHPMLKDAA